MGRKEDKNRILESVKEYIEKYHIDHEFKQGDRINYGGRVYDYKEVVNLVDASLDFWLTQSEYTDRFEKKLAEYLGIRYVSFVNSGSSANLLAINALMDKDLKDRRIRKGDEVITVACGFPTTVNPIIQSGLVPVFVDITIPEYNIDVSKLKDALSDKTKAVMLAHTMGKSFDIQYIKDFCDRNNLWLIEDNCDSLGSKYLYNGQYHYTGTIADIATSSFYPSHHITTGEGGAVYTDDLLLHKIINSLRDWGRDCICPPGRDNTCKKRFNGTYGSLPEHYDHKYVYSHLGYNLKATDLQAAIGLAQLDKLDDFIRIRKQNYDYLYSLLKDKVEDKLILPSKDDNVSPFGFIITAKENIDTNEIINKLEEYNIQTRKVFAGNITRQPYFDDLIEGKDYRIVKELNNTDYVMEHSFWIGIYPKIDKKAIEYMAEKLISIIN